MKHQSTTEELRELEDTHRNLDKELRMLTRRAFLTPEEQKKAQDIKKRKLSAKDKIYALRRGLERDAKAR